jgi:hypothetical protein
MSAFAVSESPKSAAKKAIEKLDEELEDVGGGEEIKGNEVSGFYGKHIRALNKKKTNTKWPTPNL